MDDDMQGAGGMGDGGTTDGTAMPADDDGGDGGDKKDDGMDAGAV